MTSKVRRAMERSGLINNSKKTNRQSYEKRGRKHKEEELEEQEKERERAGIN